MNTFNGYVQSNTPHTSIGNYYGQFNPSKLPVTYVNNPFNRYVEQWLSRRTNNQTTNPNTANNTGQQIKKGWDDMSLGQKANTVMGTAGTLLSAYNAYKANKLAKEQFNHAKQVQAQNWDAQRKQTNSQLEDRQRRRVEEARANGRTTMSVGDYMAKYGI